MKRRLLFLLLWLFLIDRAVPPLLERLERRHYESGNVFRFENSDLFGLGPFAAYIREHPRHGHRRVVFFGNSMLFGFSLSPGQAIPAQYQRFVPDAHVYNAAINGQEMGTAYLVAKNILDDVDLLYVQVNGSEANPLLPSLVPVAEADLVRFGLPAPNRAEQRLSSALGSVWNLYRLNYRLQAALFGTSTRVYLYLHKRDPASFFRAPLLQPENVPPEALPDLTIRAPRQNGPVADKYEWQRIKIDLANLAKARGKRVVFLAFDWNGAPQSEPEAATFNAAFAPYAEIVIVHVPPAATLDGEHVTRGAAARIAELVAQHEREVQR